MVITAKILHIGDERSGVSEHGAWCFTPINVEWEQQDNPATSPYRQSAVIDVKGRLNREAIETAMHENKPVTLWMDMRCKEHNGRFYNGIRGNIGQEFKRPSPNPSLNGGGCHADGGNGKSNEYDGDNSITDNNCDGV